MKECRNGYRDLVLKIEYDKARTAAQTGSYACFNFACFSGAHCAPSGNQKLATSCAGASAGSTDMAVRMGPGPLNSAWLLTATLAVTVTQERMASF